MSTNFPELGILIKVSGFKYYKLGHLPYSQYFLIAFFTHRIHKPPGKFSLKVFLTAYLSLNISMCLLNSWQKLLFKIEALRFY